jgi:hypothetical protein
MANYVTISSFGPTPLKCGGKLKGQAAVDNMINHWDEKLSRIKPDNPDLIVVPEACDRYSDMSAEEKMDYYAVRADQVKDFFCNKARELNSYIAYSAARQVEDGTWRNSTQIIDRHGKVSGIYNKNHVVVTETTQGGILCGRQAKTIQTDFGKIACVICFDLNFDELRIKYRNQSPDLLIFCSMYHGGLMQSYWAYNCRSHFVGAVAGLPCEIISPDGRTLAKSTNYFDNITHTVNLDCKLVHLDFNWEKLDKLKTKYGREVSITDPGYLGAVLVTSEKEGVSIDEMIEEFEIELLDDYMMRSLYHRHTHENMEP